MQHKTFEIEDEKKHGLLIQLKHNQKELHNYIDQLLRLEQPTKIYIAPIEKRHGFIKHRKANVYQHHLSGHLLDEQWPKHIKTVVLIERKRQIKDTAMRLWEAAEEKSLFLTNKVIDAQYANQLVRDHWGIENKIITFVTPVLMKMRIK